MILIFKYILDCFYNMIVYKVAAHTYAGRQKLNICGYYCNPLIITLGGMHGIQYYIYPRPAWHLYAYIVACIY